MGFIISVIKEYTGKLLYIYKAHKKPYNFSSIHEQQLKLLRKPILWLTSAPYLLFFSMLYVCALNLCVCVCATGRWSNHSVNTFLAAHIFTANTKQLYKLFSKKIYVYWPEVVVVAADLNWMRWWWQWSWWWRWLVYWCGEMSGLFLPIKAALHTTEMFLNCFYLNEYLESKTLSSSQSSPNFPLYFARAYFLSHFLMFSL